MVRPSRIQLDSMPCGEATPHGKVESSDSMQTSPDASAPSVGARGLELHIAARNSSAVLTLHNGGLDQLRVLSHVDATDRHYDCFTISLARAGQTRLLRFHDDRNESARVVVDLAPGQAIEHTIDIVAWAKRKVNGAQPLAPGTYRMSATYQVSEAGPLWNGKLVSPTIDITF
jgi:hypothetical protein